MRIIAGKAGRKAIKVPKEVTRPTTDFVRQAVFSILGEWLDGARVLDLFAGSGALGLEALSRGAASCVFVDESRHAQRVMEGNLKACGLEGGRVLRAEVHGWLARDVGVYDLIFVDPPYLKTPADVDHLGRLFALPSLAERLADDGYLLCEASEHFPSPETPGWRLVDRRRYGSSSILLYAVERAS